MDPKEIGQFADGALMALIGVFALLVSRRIIGPKDAPGFSAAMWHDRNERLFRTVGWVCIIGGVFLTLRHLPRW